MFQYKATAEQLGQETRTVPVLPKDVSLPPALGISKSPPLALAATQLELSEYLLNDDHGVYSVTS